jgi:Uma2 family endonuclease
MLGHVLLHSAEEYHLMGMPVIPGTVTTTEELLALPGDGLRHELLDGLHVVTLAPSYQHQLVLTQLLVHFANAVRGHEGWRVLPSPADIVLGPKTLVQPDVFMVRVEPDHMPLSWQDVGVPVIAIEILSPSTAARDRVVKRCIYRAAGVSEYWIVDIDRRVIERWRPDDERPEVCDRVLEWALAAGPSGSLGLQTLFGAPALT